VLAAALASAGTASAGVLVRGPVEVSVERGGGIGPQSAFMPVPFEVNNPTGAAHEVKLELRALQGAFRQTFKVDPGEHRQAMLPVAWNVQGGTVRAWVDGKAGDSDSLYWERAYNAPVMVVGAYSHIKAQLPETWAVPGHNDDEEHRPSSPQASVRLVDGAAVPDALSMLAGYHAVAVLEPAWDELKAPQRAALEAYAATGGFLLVRGVPSRPAEAFPRLPPEQAAADATSVRDYGFGQLLFCTEDCKARLLAVPMGRDGAFADRGSPSPSMGEDGSDYLPPGMDLMLEVAHAPVGSFLLIVLLFALVIGPGSFVVRRRYGPQGLVLFIPGTALVTCLGIATYGVLREGLFTLHSSAQVVTLLDAEHHAQATLAVGAFYAGISPRETRFGTLTAPLLIGRRDRNALEVDASSGLSLQGGYIPSREYVEHQLVSVEPSRARLGAKVSGGGATVENALGAAIVKGELRLGGKTYVLGAVGDGQGATAAEGKLDPKTDWTEPPKRQRFTKAVLDRSVLAPLQEGEFLVKLDRAAFLPAGGLGLTRHDEFQLVRGKVVP
jgi:hypothetical protein